MNVSGGQGSLLPPAGTGARDFPDTPQSSWLQPLWGISLHQLEWKNNGNLTLAFPLRTLRVFTFETLTMVIEDYFNVF